MTERPSGWSLTLTEIMVALAVLGLVLVIVFRIYVTGILSVGRGFDELRLALAGEAVLARTRLDPDPRQAQAEGRPFGMLDWYPPPWRAGEAG